MDEELALLTLGIMTVATAGFLFGWARTAVVIIRRRVQHLCASCGYSRRGSCSRVCPECGRPWNPA